MNIKCEIDEVYLVNNDGRSVVGTCATCTRCGLQEESFGTAEPSVMRCLMLIRENCPGGRRHFYIEDDGEPEDREGHEARYEGDPTCCFTGAGLAVQQRIEAIYRGKTA